ncbi:hypothetical protein GDO78_014624 [Eleutherodactylus coqui]|uniref:Uncharacterized protein n=1 Tax=Eleutherodactylus coqui TaxID=57060 RepID=A0A8J6E8U0_ELECQ|nr:hypothetical protein GDO78_014624 [Eleutherodactylus coqui]
MWVTEFPAQLSWTKKVHAPDQIPYSSRFFTGVPLTSPKRLNQVMISSEDRDSLRVNTVTVFASSWRDRGETPKSRQPGRFFTSS